jgi:hypothetical protein
MIEIVLSLFKTEPSSFPKVTRGSKAKARTLNTKYIKGCLRIEGSFKELNTQGHFGDRSQD